MSMGWTHTLCDECYRHEEPGREPVRILDAERETCCRCGHETLSGVYYRAAPNKYACGGEHGA